MLTDKLKQLVAGRSEAIERAVDAAVVQVGRYGETLQRQAEVVKDKVRALDDTRAGAPDAAAEAVPTDVPAEATITPDAPTPTTGTGLRGDLVEDRPVPPAP